MIIRGFQKKKKIILVASKKLPMETVSKIYFLNNPYPNGHQIIAFNWRGRIDEDKSVWFDFHLKTEKYYADDQNEDIEEATEVFKTKLSDFETMS